MILTSRFLRQLSNVSQDWNSFILPGRLLGSGDCINGFDGERAKLRCDGLGSRVGWISAFEIGDQSSISSRKNCFISPKNYFLLRD